MFLNEGQIMFNLDSKQKNKIKLEIIEHFLTFRPIKTVQRKERHSIVNKAMLCLKLEIVSCLGELEGLKSIFSQLDTISMLIHQQITFEEYLDIEEKTLIDSGINTLELGEEEFICTDNSNLAKNKEDKIITVGLSINRFALKIIDCIEDIQVFRRIIEQINLVRMLLNLEINLENEIAENMKEL